MQKKIKCLLILTALIFSTGISYASIEDFAVNKKSVKGKFRSFFHLDSNSLNHKYTTSDYLNEMNPEKWGIKIGGYISVDLNWDTRRNVNAREGSLTLYPLDIVTDANGKDINARPSFNIVAMNTRLSARIQAPQALGANISGMIEGWFIGVSNVTSNSFALRHAFISMQWPTTKLLLGQTWHPLFTENCFAYTVSGSAGAPFQPFSRAPQIRMDQTFKKYHHIVAYISSQRDYSSLGHKGNSSEYLRYSAIPESGLQYYLKIDKENKFSTLFGFGGDYKYLLPRETTADNISTQKGIHSWAALVYFNYCSYLKNESHIGIKAKAVWSCGFNDMLSVGGYAVKYYDSRPLNQNMDYDYIGLHNISAWIDIYAKIKTWEFALFAGYCENIGAMKNIQDWNNPQSYFMSNYNIKNIYRIAPRIKYNAKKLQFAFEPEYTSVCYGDTRNSLGMVQKPNDNYPAAQLHSVHNIRFLFSTTLFF